MMTKYRSGVGLLAFGTILVFQSTTGTPATGVTPAPLITGTGSKRCVNPVRKYYYNYVCDASTCKHVKCPLYTCEEMSFLKTEAEILARYNRTGTRGDQRVHVRKVPRFTRIRINARGRGQPGGRTGRSSRAKRWDSPALKNYAFGCQTLIDVSFNADGVYDGVNYYRLVSVPIGCGTALYQPVIRACCVSDSSGCCNIHSSVCDMVTIPISYLVTSYSGGTKIVAINTPMCCECFNIGVG